MCKYHTNVEILVRKSIMVINVIEVIVLKWFVYQGRILQYLVGPLWALITAWHRLPIESARLAVISAVMPFQVFKMRSFNSVVFFYWCMIHFLLDNLPQMFYRV